MLRLQIIGCCSDHNCTKSKTLTMPGALSATQKITNRKSWAKNIAAGNANLSLDTMAGKAEYFEQMDAIGLGRSNSGLADLPFRRYEPH